MRNSSITFQLFEGATEQHDGNNEMTEMKKVSLGIYCMQLLKCDIALQWGTSLMKET